MTNDAKKIEEEMEKEQNKELREKEQREEALRRLESLKKEMKAREKTKEFEVIKNDSEKLCDEELKERIKNYFQVKEYEKIARYLCVCYLKRKFQFITDYRTDIIKAYSEEDKYYKDIGVEMIKSFLTQEIGEHNTKNTSEEILHLLRTQTYVQDEEINKRQPLNLIPFKNGIFNIKTKELIPHSHNFLFDFQIPVEYKPEATCPKIDKFFSEIVEQKDLPLLYDIIGFALYRINYIEKFFILTGEGQNGKSKYLSLIEKFIGEENHSSITLKQLTEDKFSVARTYKKLVNIGADIGGGVIEDTSMLKSASGTDRISGQFKFGQIFDFRPSATLIYSANHPPVFADDSTGMYRRTELIHFPNEFGNEEDMKENPKIKKANPNIIEEITSPEELSGLLNKAIFHLEKILNTGQLSIVKSAKKLKKDYILYSNNVQAFVEESCIEIMYQPQDKQGFTTIPASGFVTISELYDAYVFFCSQNKLPLKTKDGFGKSLGKLRGVNIELRQQDYVDGVRQRSVRGLELSPEYKQILLLKKDNDTAEQACTADTPSLFSKSIQEKSDIDIRISKAVSGVQGVTAVQDKPENINILDLPKLSQNEQVEEERIGKSSSDKKEGFKMAENGSDEYGTDIRHLEMYLEFNQKDNMDSVYKLFDEKLINKWLTEGLIMENPRGTFRIVK